jgi:hypothetical protein
MLVVFALLPLRLLILITILLLTLLSGKILEHNLRAKLAMPSKGAITAATAAAAGATVAPIGVPVLPQKVWWVERDVYPSQYDDC